MTLDIQFKLKSNPNYIKYLRENSNWYKLLTRDPNMFDKFKEEVMINYKLRPVDKISKTLDTISMIQNLISTMKQYFFFTYYDKIQM